MNMHYSGHASGEECWHWLESVSVCVGVGKVKAIISNSVVITVAVG